MCTGAGWVLGTPRPPDAAVDRPCALDEPDDDDELVAEVLRVADANTVDGAVDTSHLTLAS